MMRGTAEKQVVMLSALTPDQLVPQDHPIRQIKPMVDRALADLSPTFNAMYAEGGRPSVPPEHLLKGCILIALYSIRSERQFCERLQYDLLFKWFLDLNIMDPAFDASTFSKNKARLLEHQVARLFFGAVLAEAGRRQLLSDEHFTVDGTLLEAWASLKSFRSKDGSGEPATRGEKNPNVDFRGEHRVNATHASTTDPEARLARKGPGKEAKLCFAGHVLMENRSGLVVDLSITHATGTAEREAALEMLDRLPGRHRATVGADKNYDTAAFVTECREMNITPHVARRVWSNLDRRTTRHPGYRLSQRVRKRVEEIFGWIKTVGGGRKLRFIGLARNQLWAQITVAAYNLVRMAKLAVVSPAPLRVKCTL
jgi:transposase